MESPERLEPVPVYRRREMESPERLEPVRKPPDVSLHPGPNLSVNSGLRINPVLQSNLFQQPESVQASNASNPLLDFFGIKYKPISVNANSSEGKSVIDIRSDIFAKSGPDVGGLPEATPYVVYRNRNEDTVLRSLHTSSSFPSNG